eukprot:gb/GEZJ01000088.1/.p1 GENE.gb/GEZJ01000088.1/~~gb/GEZJ01000088.1/.p1  ORF type:complete len:444 (-),score=60.84 gb/GEZJ01000088.1/:4010-5341(-)
MPSTTLYLSFEVGNLVVWLWLEVLALAAVIVWTTDSAKIYVSIYWKRSKTLRLRAKRTLIDFIPMNGDLRVVPQVPKLIITLARITVTILVAVSALGIDQGLVYTRYAPTTHVISATDAQFSGRSYDGRRENSRQDFAVAACEDVNVISLVKFKGFVSGNRFSCESSINVGEKEKVVEVIWDHDTVQQISDGQALQVNIALGERSALSEGLSNDTFVVLEDSTGAPVHMSVVRRKMRNTTFGTCDRAGNNAAATLHGEFLVFSNDIDEVGEIEDELVTVAYAICNHSSTVSLRATDEMIALPFINAQQQMILARNVANSLLSIVPDSSQKLYFGDTRRVTIIKKKFNYLILGLAISNVGLLILCKILKHCVKRDVHVDPFSSISMFWLGRDYGREDGSCNRPVSQDILIQGRSSSRGVQICAVEADKSGTDTFSVPSSTDEEV